MLLITFLANFVAISSTIGMEPSESVSEVYEYLNTIKGTEYYDILIISNTLQVNENR